MQAQAQAKSIMFMMLHRSLFVQLRLIAQMEQAGLEATRADLQMHYLLQQMTYGTLANMETQDDLANKLNKLKQNGCRCSAEKGR